MSVRKRVAAQTVRRQATARNITETASRSIRASGFKAFDENDLSPDQKRVLDEALKTLESG